MVMGMVMTMMRVIRKGRLSMPGAGFCPPPSILLPV
jgi:hypothetical protein